MSDTESTNAPTPDNPPDPPETIFVCPVCPKHITERDKLRVHIAKHMRPINFKCNVCNERFVIKPDLIRHVKRSHRNGVTETRTVCKFQNAILDYTCRVCGESITSKMVLERHALTHNNQQELLYHCRKCLKGFATQTEFNEHKESEHDGPASIYRLPGQGFDCQTCGKVLHTRRTYDEHLRLHTKEYHYYCKECNKGFMRKNQLTQHMETLHVTIVTTAAAEPEAPAANAVAETKGKKQKDTVAALICALCTKELPDEESYNYHTKLHSSDFLYLCLTGKFGDFERNKFIRFLKTYWNKEDQRSRLDSVLNRAKVDPEELEELVTDLEQFLRSWLEVDQVFGDTAMMQESARLRDGIYLPRIIEKRMEQMSQKFTDSFF